MAVWCTTTSVRMASAPEPFTVNSACRRNPSHREVNEQQSNGGGVSSANWPALVMPSGQGWRAHTPTHTHTCRLLRPAVSSHSADHACTKDWTQGRKDTAIRRRGSLYAADKTPTGDEGSVLSRDQGLGAVTPWAITQPQHRRALSETSPPKQKCRQQESKQRNHPHLDIHSLGCPVLQR